MTTLCQLANLTTAKLNAWCGYRIDELLERVDAGSQVVATDHVDVVEDVATPRRDSSVTAWVPMSHPRSLSTLCCIAACR